MAWPMAPGANAKTAQVRIHWMLSQKHQEDLAEGSDGCCSESVGGTFDEVTRPDRTRSIRGCHRLQAMCEVIAMTIATIMQLLN